MFVRISNTPRGYAWGAPGAISALLGRAATSEPEAELWLGAHPGSPSHIVDPATVSGAEHLAQWIEVDRLTALGDADELPFLFKVLAAGAPLSLQVHPDAAQAAAGWARENAAGIPLPAPERSYRDASAKPELLLALTEFEALCGFRPAHEVRAELERLAELGASINDLLGRLDDPGEAVSWLLSGQAGALVGEVTAVAARHPEQFALVAGLAAAYPGDPGAVIALLLNHVVLQPGQAIFVGAGVIHSYSRGLGLEVMAPSDNVLRGGLTPKHVDVPELLAVLDARASAVPLLAPDALGPAARAWRPEAAGFQLVEVTGDAQLPALGPAIALCLDGSFGIVGQAATATLTRGDAVFITPEEGELTLRGEGRVYVAAGSAGGR